MAEHTPGPFHVGPEYQGRPSLDVLDQNGDGVARVHDWVRSRVEVITDFDDPVIEISREQAHADALLLAAAPELLFALEGMLDAHQCQDSTCQFEQVAKAAINKAYGAEVAR